MRLLSILCLCLLMAGCNDSDDVSAIFTGKTWKLNYITVDGGHEMFNFWGSDEAARKQSYQELNTKTGSYNLTFEGTPEGNRINGTVRGTSIAGSSLEGTWSADGESNDFRAAVKGNHGNDQLAKNFLEGLNAATSYEGDTNGNLYLIYKAGQQTFRMVFRELK